MTRSADKSVFNSFPVAAESVYEDYGLSLDAIPLPKDPVVIENTPELMYEKSSALIMASVGEDVELTGKARQALNAVGFELYCYAMDRFGSVQKMNTDLGDKILYLHIPARRFMTICGVGRHYDDFRGYLKELKRLDLSFDNGHYNIESARLRLTSVFHDIILEDGVVKVGMTPNIRREFTQAPVASRFNLLTAHQKLRGNKYELALYEYFCQFVTIKTPYSEVIEKEVPHKHLLSILKAKYSLKKNKRGQTVRDYGYVSRPSIFEQRFLQKIVESINNEPSLHLCVEYEKVEYGKQVSWRFKLKSNPEIAESIAQLETEFSSELATIHKTLSSIKPAQLNKERRLIIEDSLTSEGAILYLHAIMEEAKTLQAQRKLKSNRVAYIWSQFNNDERRDAFYSQILPSLLKARKLSRITKQKNESESIRRQTEAAIERLKTEAVENFLIDVSADEALHQQLEDEFNAWCVEQNQDPNNFFNEHVKSGMLKQFILDKKIQRTQDEWEALTKNTEIHAYVDDAKKIQDRSASNDEQ